MSTKVDILKSQRPSGQFVVLHNTLQENIVLFKTFTWFLFICHFELSVRATGE